MIYYFAYQERLALNFVDAADIHLGELHLQIVGEHAGVEFGHDHTFVVPEYFTEIGGQGIDVA